MADLIAKVSRSSTTRTDLSQVYSHAASQLASGHHDAQLAFPRPAKFPNKQLFNTSSSSDVELDDIFYGREFAPGEGLEINMKSEVHVRVESAGASTKEGSEIGTIGEEDTRPLKGEDMEREATEHAQRIGVENGMGVHSKAWGASSEGGEF